MSDKSALHEEVAALRAELEAARTKLEAEYSRVQGYREHVDKLTAERDAALERVEALTVKCDLLAVSLKKADREYLAVAQALDMVHEPSMGPLCPATTEEIIARVEWLQTEVTRCQFRLRRQTDHLRALERVAEAARAYLEADEIGAPGIGGLQEILRQRLRELQGRGEARVTGELVKCPTCRCKIVPGSVCSCCAEPYIPELDEGQDLCSQAPLQTKEDK